MGFPDVSILPELGEALGLSVKELLDGERRASGEENTAQTVRAAVEVFK